jgi:hypothetical protein
VSVVASDHPLLDPMVLPEDDEHIVARVVLRLTAYLAEPLKWAQGTAAEILDAFLATEGNGGNYWFTTSMMDRWACVDTRGLPEVREHVSIGWHHQVRHQFHFQLAKTVYATHLGFRYREVDAARHGRAGVIEIVLPAVRDPGQLFSLASAIVMAGPVHSMIGGFGVDYSRELMPTAFTWAHRWSKRYLGLDVQDPDRTSLEAAKGAPGVNWLTYVSADVAEHGGLSVQSLGARYWGRDDVTSIPLGDGVLIRAGETPVLADNNRFELPVDYSAVATALAPAILEPARELPGLFRENASTRAYLRRFIDPIAWEDVPASPPVVRV